MAEHVIKARTIRTCDRCRKDITDEKPQFQQTMRLFSSKVRRWLTKWAVSHGDEGPRVLVADIHFCNSCWWEFDRLFCQGQPVPLAAGVKSQKFIPRPDYLAATPSSGDPA